jgi:hypothetical protein
MEILRVAENITSDGIEVTIRVPGDHTESDHVLSITDLSDFSISEQELVTAGGESLTFHLDKNFDNSYEVELLLDGDVIFSESYEVVRPYLDPYAVAETATEIAEVRKLERLSRAIVDSFLDNIDFYNKKVIYEVTGNGLDLMPVWKDVNRVLKVYENNELVYDVDAEENPFVFALTKDKSAIYKVVAGVNNVIDARVPSVPVSPTDYIDLSPTRATFRTGNDFAFVLDTGYKTLPSSVVDATEMLVDDLKCGRLDYFQRYVTSYNTDQYRIQFDKKVLEGTGNILVDKILEKYRKSITRVGVL